MEIKLDLHTHTSFSPHAYRTLMENRTFAKERGMEAIAMTNHGMDSADFSHEWHFANFKHLPRVINDVVVFTGVECSYIDEAATLDLQDERLEKMDIVIASRHGGSFAPDETNFVKVLLNACKNKYIDILGHIARTSFSLTDEEYDQIAKAAKENGKLIELNESCFGKKTPSFVENSRKLMLACKKHGTMIVVNSDAHFCTHVGKFDRAVAMLEEIGFDEELVMNTSLDKFLSYITKRKDIDMLRGE
ncbi:MAG: phosphatase [Clostridia bacterium]|nr:phosphatase [Clostridia bacterium]